MIVNCLLYSGHQKDGADRWVQHVVADPRVRLRVGDTIHPPVAVKVPDQTEWMVVGRVLNTDDTPNLAAFAFSVVYDRSPAFVLAVADASQYESFTLSGGGSFSPALALTDDGLGAIGSWSGLADLFGQTTGACPPGSLVAGDAVCTAQGLIIGSITFEFVGVPSDGGDSFEIVPAILPGVDGFFAEVNGTNLDIGDQVEFNPVFINTAPIPEPSSASPAGLGLLALGAIGRRRRAGV